MLKLNIRHSLPQIGLRIQHSRVDQAHNNQPQITGGHNRQARTTQGSTQARIDIDSYQSRHAYGNSTMSDFTRENGDRGLSNVQSAVSSKAGETWAIINNASKSGNYVADRAERNRESDIEQQSYLVAAFIPNPITTVAEPARVEGEMDVGTAGIEIDVPRAPTIEITTGSVETYIRDRGFLRQWTTQDRFDIYA